MRTALLLAACAALAAFPVGAQETAAAQDAAASAKLVYERALGAPIEDALLGMGNRFLGGVLDPAELPLEQAEEPWTPERLAADLRQSYAPYAAEVDAALFADLAGRVDSTDLDLLVADGEPARAAALDCVLSTAPGEDGYAFDSCAARHDVELGPETRAAAERYIAALSAALVGPVPNVGLGTAVCDTVLTVLESLSDETHQLEMQSLTFGLGRGNARSCNDIFTEANRLWPPPHAEALR